jgi:hypothetical protein
LIKIFNAKAQSAARDREEFVQSNKKHYPPSLRSFALLSALALKK